MSQEVFLSVGFRSSVPDGNLRTIELIGVPGQKMNDGQSVISDKAKQFFDNTLIRKVFSESRHIPECEFEFIKIWLDGPELRKREYDIPEIQSPPDYEIQCNIPSSRLKSIYVLRDNKLVGNEGQRWKKTVDQIFTPLFREFMAPPEISESLSNNPLARLVGSLVDSVVSPLDQYAKMKKNLFFDTLIVQIN